MEYINFDNKVFKKTEYEGYYVSQEGDIITVKVKGGQGRINFDNPRYHSVKIDKDGYREVCLSTLIDGNHKRKYKRLHRLIWETFNGDIPNNLTIDHIDNNKQNNNINNLQLLTRGDNTSKANKKRIGEKRILDSNKKYKLTIKHEFKGLFTYSELVNEYKISEWHISQFKKGNYPKKLLEKGILLERV